MGDFINPQNLQDYKVVVYELKKRVVNGFSYLDSNIISRPIIVLAVYGYTAASYAMHLNSIMFIDEDGQTAMRDGDTKGNVFLQKGNDIIDAPDNYVSGDNLRALLAIGVVPEWFLVTPNRLTYFDQGGTLTGGYVVVLQKVEKH